MNTQVYEEASEWFVEVRSGEVDADGRRRFDRWLRQSPDHLRAYLEIIELWQDAAEVGFGSVGDVQDLIERARAEHSVIPLDPPRRNFAGSATAPLIEARSGRRRLLAMAASVAMFAICVAWVVGMQMTRASEYATAIGEQRRFTLDDGSTVELNTQSKVRIHFTDRERRVELLAGQALFQVARQAARPFVVSSGPIQALAVGTQFDVYRRADSTAVTVIEGKVLVSRGAATQLRDLDATTASVAEQSPDSALLIAGQQIVAAAGSAMQPRRANVSAATAWTRQKLVLRSSSLMNVAEEFNRYNRRPLIVTDPELAQFQVSGVYSSTNPALLLKFLREQPGIRVEETESAVRISREK